MDLAILIAIGCVAFGFGVWFHRITTKLNTLDKRLIPLIIIHKKELLKYYLEKGVMPNPSLTQRKHFLVDKLEAGTIGYSESQELANLLKEDERKAKEAGNTEALVAILGLIALVVIWANLSKKG